MACIQEAYPLNRHVFKLQRFMGGIWNRAAMIRFGSCMSQGGSLVTQIRTDELLSTCVCAQRDGGVYIGMSGVKWGEAIRFAQQW